MTLGFGTEYSSSNCFTFFALFFRLSLKKDKVVPKALTALHVPNQTLTCDMKRLALTDHDVLDNKRCFVYSGLCILFRVLKSDKKILAIMRYCLPSSVLFVV